MDIKNGLVLIIQCRLHRQAAPSLRHSLRCGWMEKASHSGRRLAQCYRRRDEHVVILYVPRPCLIVSLLTCWRHIQDLFALRAVLFAKMHFHYAVTNANTD